MLETEERKKMYEQAGISAPVFEYGEKICTSLKERFETIDEMAEYNQLKVLQAFHKNRVSAEHMYGVFFYLFDYFFFGTFSLKKREPFFVTDCLHRSQPFVISFLVKSGHFLRQSLFCHLVHPPVNAGICMERQDMVTMTVDATPWKKCTPIFFMPKMLW